MMISNVAELKTKNDIVKLSAQFQLLSQLKHFGLDPKEWRFQNLEWNPEKTGAVAEVTNRKDQNLRIKGRVAKHLPSPKNLNFWYWTDLCWDL